MLRNIHYIFTFNTLITQKRLLSNINSQKKLQNCKSLILNFFQFICLINELKFIK